MMDTQVSRPRFVWRAIAMVFLAAFAYLGLHGGIDDLHHATTAGRLVQAVFQTGYGALSVLVLAAVLWMPKATRVLMWMWAVAASGAAGLAPVVWGNTPVSIGVVSGISAALIAWLLGRGLR